MKYILNIKNTKKLNNNSMSNFLLSNTYLYVYIK